MGKHGHVKGTVEISQEGRQRPFRAIFLPNRAQVWVGGRLASFVT